MPIVITSGFATPPKIDDVNPAIARIVAKPYQARDAAGWLRCLGCSPTIRADRIQVRRREVGTSGGELPMPAPSL